MPSNRNAKRVESQSKWKTPINSFNQSWRPLSAPTMLYIYICDLINARSHNSPLHKYAYMPSVNNVVWWICIFPFPYLKIVYLLCRKQHRRPLTLTLAFSLWDSLRAKCSFDIYECGCVCVSFRWTRARITLTERVQIRRGCLTYIYIYCL